MNKIIRIDEVSDLTGLSKSTIRRREIEDTFPKRVKIGKRSVGWDWQAIQTWINEGAQLTNYINLDTVINLLNLYISKIKIILLPDKEQFLNQYIKIRILWLKENNYITIETENFLLDFFEIK